MYLELLGRIEGDPASFRDAGLIQLFERKDPAAAKPLLRASLALNPNQPDVREVEQRIRATDKEAAPLEVADARPKKDEPVDHSSHDCALEGCEAKEMVERAKKDREPPMPRAVDPLAGLIPKPNVPTGGPRPGAPRPATASPSARPQSPAPSLPGTGAAGRRLP